MVNQFDFLAPDAIAWEARLISDVDSPIWDMTVDSSGNVYVVGRVDNALAGNAYAGSYDTWAAKYSPDGELLWVDQFGTPYDDRSWAVAVYDDALYVAGRTAGSLGADLVGETDIFVAQYDLDGTLIWVEQMGTLAIDATNALAIDPDGNPVVVGWSEGSPDSAQGVVTLRYGPDGSLITNQTAELAGQATIDGRIVVGGGHVDAEGYIYAAGDYTVGTGDKEDVDVFASKHDPEGNLLWEATLASPANERCFDMEADAEGNVYLVGWTLGELEGTSAGDEDAFIAKFDPNGELLWVDQFGTPFRDFAYGLAIDDNGNVYATGYSQYIADDEETMVAITWLANYNAEGDLLWQFYLNTDYNDFARAIDLDEHGNIYLAGYTLGEKGENPQGERLNLTTTDSNKDAWVIKIDADVLPSEALDGGAVTGDPEAALLDLTAMSDPVVVEFTVNREAAYDNVVGYYAVTDASGGIDLDGDGLADVQPGDEGYTEAALATYEADVLLATTNGQETVVLHSLDGGALYAPLIVVDASPTTVDDGQAVYFAFAAANGDGLDHIQVSGNTLMVEDIAGGGDRDFNDVVVTVAL